MSQSKVHIDQLGRKVKLNGVPERIITLVPSQTELLYDLGLADRVVGITKFCIHPKKWFRTKERVGGTKALDLGKIRNLNPDLIIANKEENEKAQIDELAEEFPVWISDVDSVGSALEMISSVGEITGSSAQADKMVSGIRDSLLESSTPIGSAIYLIWNEPMMTAGTDSFISNMMSMAGFENVLQGTRYPEVSVNELRSINPDFILLSSEPFPFKEEHRKDYQARFPDSTVILVDGEMFSWYGSRMLKAGKYFKRLSAELHSVKP